MKGVKPYKNRSSLQLHNLISTTRSNAHAHAVWGHPSVLVVVAHTQDYIPFNAPSKQHATVAIPTLCHTQHQDL
jgi:hypothetical protein